MFHVATSAAPGLLAGGPTTLRNVTLAVHLACSVALATVVVGWFIQMRSLTGRALILVRAHVARLAPWGLLTLRATPHDAQEKDAKLLRVKEAAARAAFHSHEQTVGFVFHELRNPLHRVLGSLWLLKEQWSHPQGHELTSELHNVERGVRQIRSLLDDVVDLDRVRGPVTRWPCSGGGVTDPLQDR